MTVKTDMRTILGGHGWPYGADNYDGCEVVQKRLLGWAKARGLRYSPHGGCLHWIATGRCTEGICCEGYGSRSWMDHITGWTLDGKPALLLSQPYHLYKKDRQKIAEVAEKFGLHVEINKRGWYGSGTTAIEFWPDASLAALE